MKALKFNEQMLKAIRDGHKTQTRRPVKTKRCPYEVGDVHTLGNGLTIKITNVSSENLQDITEEDAKAEGVEPTLYPVCCGRGGMECCGDPEPAEEFIPPFRDVWDDIYFDKGYGWETNSLVWVLHFEKVPEFSRKQVHERVNSIEERWSSPAPISHHNAQRDIDFLIHVARNSHKKRMFMKQELELLRDISPPTTKCSICHKLYFTLSFFSCPFCDPS